jgi:hypothetical protein
VQFIVALLLAIYFVFVLQKEHIANREQIVYIVSLVDSGGAAQFFDFLGVAPSENPGHIGAHDESARTACRRRIVHG